MALVLDPAADTSQPSAERSDRRHDDRLQLIEGAVRQVAHTVEVVFTPYNVASRADIERAFLKMKNERPDALLPCCSLVLLNHRDLLFDNAVRLRVSQPGSYDCGRISRIHPTERPGQ